MKPATQAAQDAAIVQAMNRANKRARIRDIKAARKAKCDAASLVAPFADVIMELSMLDDDTVDMLLTVDYDVQADNNVSIPAQRLRRIG